MPKVDALRFKALANSFIVVGAVAWSVIRRMPKVDTLHFKAIANALIVFGALLLRLSSAN